MIVCKKQVEIMKRFLSITTWLVALLIVAGFLLFFEADLLWKLQEQNLFLNTSQFFNERMLVPGGLLSWIGTWLTQFFYYPWLGTLLLCVCWLLMMWLVKRAFKVADQWWAVMLVPVALLLLTIVDMGYWLYMLKLQGHFFVSTIGTTAVVALLWAYRCVPAKWYLRTVLVFLTCIVAVLQNAEFRISHIVLNKDRIARFTISADRQVVIIAVHLSYRVSRIFYTDQINRVLIYAFDFYNLVIHNLKF